MSGETRDAIDSASALEMLRQRVVCLIKCREGEYTRDCLKDLRKGLWRCKRDSERLELLKEWLLIYGEVIH